MTRPHDNYTPGAPGVRMFHNLANRVLGTFRGQPAEPDMNIFVTRDVVRMRDGSMSLAGSSAASWAAPPAPQRSARRNAMVPPAGVVWPTEQQWEQENVGPTGVARARAQTLAKLTGQMIDPPAYPSTAPPTTTTFPQSRGRPARASSSHMPSVPDLRTAARFGDVGPQAGLDFPPRDRRTRDTLHTDYTNESIDTSASTMWRRRQRVQSESGTKPTPLVGPWQQARPTYFGHERVAAENFGIGPQYIGDIDEDEEGDYEELPFLTDETPLPVRDSLPHSVASTFGSRSRPSSSEGTSYYTAEAEPVPLIPPPRHGPRDWRRDYEVLRLAGLSGAPQLLQRSASFSDGRAGAFPNGTAGAAAGRRSAEKKVFGMANRTSRDTPYGLRQGPALHHQTGQQRNVYDSHPRPAGTTNLNGHSRPLYEDWYDPRRRPRPARVTSVSSNAAVAYFPLG